MSPANARNSNLSVSVMRMVLSSSIALIVTRYL